MSLLPTQTHWSIPTQQTWVRPQNTFLSNMVMFFNSAIIIKNWTSAIRYNEWRHLLCKQQQCKYWQQLVNTWLKKKKFALRNMFSAPSTVTTNPSTEQTASWLPLWLYSGTAYRVALHIEKDLVKANIHYLASICSLSSCITGSCYYIVMTQRIEPSIRIYKIE